MHYQNSIVFTQTMDLYLDRLSSLKTTDYAFMRGVIRTGHSYFAQLQGISSIYVLQVQKIVKSTDPVSSLNDPEAVDEIITNIREYSAFVEQKKVQSTSLEQPPAYSGRGRRAAGVSNPTTVARKNRLIKNIGNLKYDIYVVRFLLRRSQMTMRSVKTGAKHYDENELLHANTKIMVPDFIFFDWLVTAFKNSFKDLDLDRLKLKLAKHKMSREEEILRIVASKSKIIILSAGCFNHYMALIKAKSLKRTNMSCIVLNENTLTYSASISNSGTSSSENSDNGAAEKRPNLKKVNNRLLHLRNEKHIVGSSLLAAETTLLRQMLKSRVVPLNQMPHDKIVDNTYIVCFVRFTFGVHSLFNMRVAGNNPFLFRDIEDKRSVSVTTTTTTNPSSVMNGGGRRGRPPLNRQIIDLVTLKSGGGNPRGRPPGSANKQTNTDTIKNNYAIVTRQRRTNDVANENLLNVNLNVATRKRRGRKPKNSTESTTKNDNDSQKQSLTSSENNSTNGAGTIVNSPTNTAAKKTKSRGRPPKLKSHSNVADTYEIIDEEQVLPPLFTPKKKTASSAVPDDAFFNETEVKQVVYMNNVSNSISSMSLNARKEEQERYSSHINVNHNNNNVSYGALPCDSNSNSNSNSKYNNEAMLINHDRKPLIEVPQPNPQQQEQCEYIVNLAPLSKKIMSRWKSESMFNHEYTMFVSVNNMVPPKLPMIAFVSINLYMMMQGGLENGGYKMINRDRKWKNIYYCLEPKTEITNATTCTRRHYERLLLPFEEYLIKLYFMELTIEYTSGGVVSTEGKSPNAIKAILNQIYPFLFDLEDKSGELSNSKESSVLISKPMVPQNFVEQAKEVEVDLNQEVDDRSQFVVEEINNQNLNTSGNYSNFCEYREELLPYNIDVEQQNSYPQVYGYQPTYAYPEEQPINNQPVQQHPPPPPPPQNEYMFSANQNQNHNNNNSGYEYYYNVNDPNYYYYNGNNANNNYSYNYPEQYQNNFDYNNYPYKYEYNQGYYVESPNLQQNYQQPQYYTYYAPEYMANMNHQSPPQPPNQNTNNTNTHVHNVNRKLK